MIVDFKNMKYVIKITYVNIIIILDTILKRNFGFIDVNIVYYAIYLFSFLQL